MVHSTMHYNNNNKGENMMDLQTFITNIPVTTRERASKIKEALDGGSVAYISLITKNNKKHFKIYYKDGTTVKTKQLKCSDITKNYMIKNKDAITLSEDARKYLNIQ